MGRCVAVMYRRALFSLYPRRTALTLPPETTLIPPARGHLLCAPVRRTELQVSRRAFGSTGVVLCEKKDGPASAPSGEVKKDEERAETKRSESAAQTESEPRAEDRREAASLLDLLATMKVTTTHKASLPKVQRDRPEAPPRPEDMESTTSMFQQATSAAAAQRASQSAALVAAASAAASTLPNSAQAKLELLQQLRKHKAVSQDQRKGESHNLGNIIADMKVGWNRNHIQKGSSARHLTFDEDDRGYKRDRSILSELGGIPKEKSSFLAKRLKIFPVEELNTDTDLAAGPSLWDADMASQIAEVINQWPQNGFEEMIQWTRDGRLWQYPVDNEAGIEEEASVPFHEHVFLERHLEEGFPKYGPIRHFMELVVTGLGKNHQLTVKQKLEHIAWFREYFQQKQDVLKEAEAY
ncbi:small ribosomal subunit protein mS31 [Salminus brasiliensis]|uniref:small ribosomal subunit protein mS31 n=1 Tax=Salminus brasiliensis TaxID=930266 RepID=UPI003B82E3DD